MKKSNHPTHCRQCHGTGWEPGPPIAGHHHGQPFDYETVQPCTNEWRDDDPTVDEHGLDTTEPITFADYYVKLLARHARGEPSAQAELDGWDHNIFGWPT
jgi:hypothetical protein